MLRIILFLFLLINISFSLHVNATNKVLRIGGFKQNTPYVTLDDKNKPNGFAVQLLTTILDDLGYQYEITLYDNNIHSIDEVLAKNDILLSQQTLKDGSKYYFFSSPYHSRQYDIIGRKGATYSGPSDLRNKTVIVRQDAHINHKLSLLGIDELCNVVYVDNIYDGIKMLSERMGDYLICDGNLSVAINQQKEVDNLITFNSGLSNVKSNYVSKDLDLTMEINREMVRMHSDGRYQDIYDKWLGVKQPFLQPRDLYLLFFGALFFLILFAILYWLMRRRVYRATHEILATKNQIEGLNRLINMLNNKIGTIIFINDEKTKSIYHLHDGSFRPYHLDYEDFVSLIHPDDLSFALKEREEFVNGVQKEINSTIRLFNKSLDKYCHYNVVLCPLKYDQNGIVYKYICSLHNDTKQQELIRQQDELIHTMNMAISTSNLMRWQYDIASNTIKYVDTCLTEFILTPEEAIHMTAPEDRTKLEEAVKDLLRDGKSQSVQIWKKYGKDEHYKLYEINFMINFDSDNEPISIFGIARDISEIHDYQSLLKEKIELLETIKNNMPVGMYIYDRNGVLIDVNDTLVRFLGLDREKLLSAKINLFDMDYVKYEMQAELRKGQTVARILHYDEIFPVLHDYIVNASVHAELFDIVCTPIMNDENEIAGYITIYYDTTERDKNRKEIEYLENKLMLSLDSGDMSAWRYDCATDVFTTIHGRNIGKTGLELNDIFEHVHPDDKELLANIVAKLKSGEIQKERCEIRVDYGKDMCWYRFSMAAEVNDGKVTYINGTWKDVNAEVRSREALEEAKLKAEESERLKMVFLANMSHEIRTPLNAIVGFSELLQHTDSAEERQQFIDIIHNNNELLLRLINDILDLSKIESGLTEFTPSVVDVVEIFHQTYSSFKKRLTDSEIELLEMCEMTSCVVKIDRSRFSQVFNNFVSNAIKYTREGTITMSIDYVSDGVRISVKDTGIGISESNYKYVFQRFQKFDNFAQGTGLGLAISKAITEMMGGEIGFTSEEKVGSEFWAWFPCELISKE